MRLALYYMGHSFKNQVRKLFRSWVAIFILVCFLFGILFGLGISLLENAVDLPDEQTQTETPAEEDPGTAGEDAGEEEEPPFFLQDGNFRAIFGLIVTAAILGVLLLGSLRADRSGSEIFLMADVNLLFPSPMKPQSVLIFRLFMQMFLLIFAGVYLGFQIPNIVHNTAVDPVTGILLVLAWIVTLIYSQLISVLIYTIASTHERLKKYVTPSIIGLVGAVAAAFLLYQTTSGQNLFAAADSFFNHPAVNWIPIAGWIKGMVLFSLDGNYLLSAVCFGLLVASGVLMIWAVWHIRADFYEDAMAGSMRREERLAAQKAGLAARRKKDRSDRTVRDRLFGSGAKMFFTKSLYNRFRFGFLHFFTKTSLFYLASALLLCVFLIFAIRTRTYLPVGLTFCFIAFIRAITGPVSEDLSHDFLVTVPAPAHAKVFWSLLGGSVNCALDLLPATVVAAIFLQADPVQIIGTFLLAVAIDFYTENTLLLVHLLLPSNLDGQVKQLFTGMFLWFGLLVPIITVILTAIFLSLTVAIFAAALETVIAGLVFYAISPILIERGRR